MHFPVEALWFFMLLFSVSVTLSPAADTIFPGKSLSGGQTLISSAGNFELGFFKPGNSQNYYVGIWYKNIAWRTVVWVANRDKPLTDDTKSVLKISEDGNLVILNQFKLPVWSSNVDPIVRNSIVAVLLDSGNLILRYDSNSSSSVLWESFDHPTDTWLPGEKIGINKTTGQTISLTSWRNSQDPAPGIFSLDMESDGIGQFHLVWNKTQQYWSSGAWNGHYFNSTVEMAANHQYAFTNVSSVNASYFTYTVLDTRLVSSFMVDTTGEIKQRQWLNGTQEWLLLCILPSDPCEVYSLCGSFGSCNTHISPPCRCMTGFQPRVARDWELNDWSSGCVRRTPLQCSDINPSSNGEKDRFLEMPNMILPENNQSVEVGSAEECQLLCLKNCSCVAYSYSSRCFIWFGDLMDAKEHTHVGGSQETSSVLYLRLAASELPTSRRTKITVLVVFVIALMGTIISCVALVLIWRRRRMYMKRKSDAIQGILLSFRYKDLQKATKNFSEKLGTGGFGSVFKGTLSDSSVVAVKKLEGLRQGEKQFRMEVRAIGTIQHVNLVPFRGFCAEGTERLLVFDYMPHGSLDSHLFRSSSKILDWSTRYQIALGIARGLAYLHEKCRECIIHCDIKPENILLDAALIPKVADFGLAKLLGREFSHVLTSMRGTIGYLAPEWISGLAITPKADVYSFGMMLLEIISGRRNTEGSEKGKYFPVEAANNVIEGKVLCLLDCRLEGNANIDQLNIACRVACWCIQDMESERPTMGLVVQMLEGLINVSVPPVSKFLQDLVLDSHDQSFESEIITGFC